MDINPPSLFRPEAEAQLNQPERLAAGLRVVEPGIGVLTVTLVLLVLLAVVGAVFVRIPIEVRGTGMVLSSKGVLQITVNAGHDGRIARLLVRLGQRVEPGQAVAEVTQPALENELLLAESERDQIMDETARVRQLQGQLLQSLDRARQQQEQNAREAIDLLNQRLRILEQLMTGQESLRQSGFSTVDRVLQVGSQVAEVRERLATRRSELLAIGLDRTEKQGQFAREMETLGARQAQAERQIRRIEVRIGNETVVRSTEHGVVTELRVVPGDLVRFDSGLVGLLPVDESFAELRPGASRLIATVFVSTEDGKKIRPGMSVLVDPRSVRRDVYGAIEGRVVRTSDIATSPEEMRRILRNDELARRLNAMGPPFLVEVDLQIDPRTRTGFRWTTSDGPDIPITIGTPVDAEIETEHVRLVGLLLPALRRWFQGPQASNS